MSRLALLLLSASLFAQAPTFTTGSNMLPAFPSWTTFGTSITCGFNDPTGTPSSVCRVLATAGAGSHFVATTPVSQGAGQNQFSFVIAGVNGTPTAQVNLASDINTAGPQWKIDFAAGTITQNGGTLGFNTSASITPYAPAVIPATSNYYLVSITEPTGAGAFGSFNLSITPQPNGTGSTYTATGAEGFAIFNPVMRMQDPLSNPEIQGYGNVFFSVGDSITADPVNGWTAFIAPAQTLEKKLDAKGGGTLANMLWYAKTHVCDVFRPLARYQIVSLEFSAVNNSQNAAATVIAQHRAYHHLLHKCGYQSIAMEILPATLNLCDSTCQATTAAVNADTEAFYWQFADAKVGWAGTPMANPADLTYYTADGLHPTSGPGTTGATAIAALVTPQIDCITSGACFKGVPPAPTGVFTGTTTFSAGSASCTMIWTNGLRTGGTC